MGQGGGGGEIQSAKWWNVIFKTEWHGLSARDWIFLCPTLPHPTHWVKSNLLEDGMIRS